VGGAYTGLVFVFVFVLDRVRLRVRVRPESEHDSELDEVPEGIVLRVITLLLFVSATVARTAPAQGHIGDLAWLAGDWQTAPTGARRVDEHWTAPSGGAMLGMSRTVKGDAMVAFEYLRIVERADGMFYVAHPNARAPGTDFRLTSLTATRVVFENPQHDFPKRIIYEKKGEHGLSAVVDAGEGTHAEKYDYVRVR